MGKQRNRESKRQFPTRARMEVSLSQFERARQLMHNPPFDVKPAPRVLVTGPDAERCGTRLALQMAGLTFRDLYPGLAFTPTHAR